MSFELRDAIIVYSNFWFVFLGLLLISLALYIFIKNKNVFAFDITSAVLVLSAWIVIYLVRYDDSALYIGFAFAIYIIISSYLSVKTLYQNCTILSIVNFLCSLGILMLYALVPPKGLLQSLNFLVSLMSLASCYVFIRLSLKARKMWFYLIGAFGAFLMVLPLILGKEVNGARAWISIFGFNFQPSEITKVIALVFISYLLSHNKILQASVYIAICLILLMLQKDLGTALIYFILGFFLVYYAKRKKWILFAGALGGIAASAIGFSMFSHVKKRVRIWINPWADSNGEGYQVVQALSAIANGGLFGTGLASGDAVSIPAYDTDFIFSVLLNEFGIIFGVCVLALYISLFLFGRRVAKEANENKYFEYLSIGVNILLLAQMLIIVGGNIKLIPLTGVTLPFMSYGGSSLIASMGLVGVLIAAAKNAKV